MQRGCQSGVTGMQRPAPNFQVSSACACCPNAEKTLRSFLLAVLPDLP
jgi:hypothetical protein